MAINYGLIQGIQPPSVVAQLPSIPNNQADSLAGGLMQGLAQGQSIAASRQNMAAQQQQMDQNKQLFPSLLQQEQQKAQSGAMDLQEKQQTAQDKLTLREAAQKDEQAWVDALSKISPDAVQDYQLKKAQVQKITADATLSGEQGKATGLDNYAKAINVQGQIYSSSLAGQSPEMRERIYQFGRSNAPEAVQKLMPPKFDQSTAIAGIMLARENMADYQEKQGEKNVTSTQKDLRRIGILTAKQKDGTISEAEQIELQGLQDVQGAKARGQTVNPTDSAIAKADEQRLKDVQKTKSNFSETVQVVDQLQKDLEKTPNLLLGPINNILNVAQLNPTAQKIIAGTNRLTLAYKNQQNMGSQGFTDKDREFVSQVNGNVSNYKGTLKELLTRTKSLAEHANAENWITEYNIQKKGSDKGKQWLTDNPEPRVTIKLPDGRTGTIPASKLRDAQAKGANLE